jgi:biopolymer transport protein ExbD
VSNRWSDLRCAQSIWRLRTPQARAVARRAVVPYRKIDFALPFGTLVLTLMIFLMLVTAQPHHASVPPLPRTPHSVNLPGALQEDALRMTVTPDGGCYFGRLAVRPEGNDLHNLIRDAVLGGAEKTMYLQVDRRARLGDLSVALDGIGLAGIATVTFLTADDRRR